MLQEREHRTQIVVKVGLALGHWKLEAGVRMTVYEGKEVIECTFCVQGRCSDKPR